MGSSEKSQAIEITAHVDLEAHGMSHHLILIYKECRGEMETSVSGARSPRTTRRVHLSRIHLLKEETINLERGHNRGSLPSQCVPALPSSQPPQSYGRPMTQRQRMSFHARDENHRSQTRHTSENRASIGRTRNYMRIFKACETCRKKKTRCILDKPDEPWTACRKCKRERRVCSLTRQSTSPAAPSRESAIDEDDDIGHDMGAPILQRAQASSRSIEVFETNINQIQICI